MVPFRAQMKIVYGKWMKLMNISVAKLTSSFTTIKRHSIKVNTEKRASKKIL